VTVAPSRHRIHLIGGIPEPMGGVTWHVHELATRLHERGWDVDVVDLRPAEPKVEHAYPLHPLSWRLVAQARRGLVHVHVSNPTSPARALVLSTIALLHGRRRCIITVHSGAAPASTRRAARTSRWLLARCIRTWIALSTPLERHFRDDLRVGAVERAGSHVGSPDGPTTERSGRPQPFRIVTSGYLTPLYQLDEVIAAVVALRPTHPDISLEIVHYGEPEPAYESLVVDLCAEHGVTLTTGLDHHAFLDLLASAALYVRHTRSDSFGVAVAEALAVGTVVLATSVCDRSDGAIVYDPNGAEDLASRIADVHGHYDAHLADLARERSRSDELDRYEAIYTRVMGARVQTSPTLALRRLKAFVGNRVQTFGFTTSTEYWNKRYDAGGHSGDGSRGRLASFKAEYLNRFVTQHDVASVLELGCGDGQQLRLADYPAYIGLDVAPRALEQAIESCQGRDRFSFLLYHPTAFHDPQRLVHAELGLSLDVIYHLTEESVFEAYMRTLFAMSDRYVICYTRDASDVTDAFPQQRHIRHWPVRRWVSEHEPEWSFVERVPNAHPFDPADPQNTSISDFYVFERR
jgi:glycosyltransferase involved in cell wall biosynthesis